MACKNEIVLHKVWGEGVITEADEQHVTVFFPKIQAKKTFVYPDVFERFLTFASTNLQTDVLAELAAKHERETAEKAAAEAKAQAEKQIHPVLTSNATHGKKPIKLPPRKNLAFKLNYCDGGATADTVGYKGVCSDKTIRYNIFEAKRTWCSYEHCPCRMYLDGRITRSELDQRLNSGVVCYESIALSDWIVQAGTNLNGIDEGTPRHIPNAQRGSLAILTTRYPETAENERVIVGVFLVDNVNEGDDKESGAVSCHSRYHIEIHPQEMDRLRFWNYYSNAGNPDAIRWGTGLYRFITDEAALALLKDIVRLKEGTSEHQLALDIMNYYLELHQV